MSIKTLKQSIGIGAAVFLAALACPSGVTAAGNTLTATGQESHREQFSPFRFDSTLMTSATDPHHEILTETPIIVGSMADTQMGIHVVPGFSQGSFDQTESTNLADFLIFNNRMTSEWTGSSLVRQLQIRISQNHLGAGYKFSNQYGVTASSVAGGYMSGPAEGKFVLTQTYVADNGQVTDLTCRGTFTYDPGNGFILTSGARQGKPGGTGCVTQ